MPLPHHSVPSWHFQLQQSETFPFPSFISISGDLSNFYDLPTSFFWRKKAANALKWEQWVSTKFSKLESGPIRSLMYYEMQPEDIHNCILSSTFPPS